MAVEMKYELVESEVADGVTASRYITFELLRTSQMLRMVT